MKNNQIWDTDRIRERINSLLDLIEARDTECESDMAGGGCPAMVGLIFILEHIADDKFFGTIELTSKGPRLIKPSVTRQTFKVDELYKSFLS